MTVLVPLVVAVPLTAAGALAAFGHHLPSRVDNVVAAGVAAAVAALSTLLIFRSSHHAIDYWFGGWHPRHGIAIGIGFHVEPLAAGISALIATLMTASELLAFDYFHEEVPQHYHVLMLAFLAGMCGFALSGDLFNMLVWFELMGIAAFALTAYRTEQPRVTQGAINFAVLNSIAAFLILAGIAFVYGRTGALNLAQIGESLRHEQPNGAVVVAFALVVCGFLVKAGAFPFHFWLADAYSVAPAPVGILFAGVMSDLGLHGIARVYWGGFAEALGGHVSAVRGVLLAVGVLTALVGALMAFLQASLKRLLAFLTIAHIGIALVGIALLTPGGLAGATVYLVADGLVRGALFFAVAHIAFDLGAVNELELFGRGRSLRVAGATVLVGALGLAAIPPLGPFLGSGLVSQSAAGLGLPGLSAVVIVATLVPAAAVLRAFGRIFLGLGPPHDPLLIRLPAGDDEGEQEEEEGEDEGRGRGQRRSGVLMRVPGLLLLAAALGLAFAPGIAGQAVRHASEIERAHATALETLRGVHEAQPPLSHVGLSKASLLYGVVSTVGAILLAAAALWWSSLPAALRLPGVVLRPVVGGLKTAHDGVTGEYVAWLTFGVAAIAAVLALLVR